MSIRQFIQIPTTLNAMRFHKTEEDWKKLKSFVELEEFIDDEEFRKTFMEVISMQNLKNEG